MLITTQNPQISYSAPRFASKAESNNSPVSSDGFRPGQSSDAGLMPKNWTLSEQPKAEKETLGDRVGFGAGMGALIGGILPGVVIPFVGFALAPVGMMVGAGVGAIIGACSGGGE